MRPNRIFVITVGGFLATAAAVGLAERFLHLGPGPIGWIFMALSMTGLGMTALLSRTSETDQYYVAARGLPPFYSGMATASDWMSAATFLSLGGALALQGYAALPYIMGWTGGYLLLSLFLAPYLRQFGRYTLSDFLAARYGGHGPRLVGVLATLLTSFTYLVAQVTGVGIIVSRFLGLDFRLAVFAGLLGVLLYSLLGGTRTLSWHQVAQYVVLTTAYLVPVMLLSWRLFANPVPEATLGRALQANQQRVRALAADPLEQATRARWAEEARAAAQRQADAEAGAEDRERAAAARALAERQAAPPWVEGEARERQLQAPRGVALWNYLALTFCLMLGTAGLPHILSRYYTTPSVRQARTSVAWSLFFVSLLYLAAPAYAALGRHALLNRLVGAPAALAAEWAARWAPTGLVAVVDKLGDGVVQLGDLVLHSGDFLVLATPELSGLPFTVTGMVLAGGLAAALSTADGLLLAIGNAVSHDLYMGVVNPKASLIKRMGIAKMALVVAAILAAWVATFRLGVIVEMVAWAFSLAAASFFPALVAGIVWKRANRAGAVAGMLTGLGTTLFYLVGSRSYGLSWFGTAPVAAGVFGIPAGFLAIALVSALTAPPPPEVQEQVLELRFPRAGAAAQPPGGR